jgi:hypothetical protein
VDLKNHKKGRNGLILVNFFSVIDITYYLCREDASGGKPLRWISTLNLPHAPNLINREVKI